MRIHTLIAIAIAGTFLVTGARASWSEGGDTTSEAKSWKKALEAYEEVVKADPQNDMGWFNLANAAYNAGDFQRAIEAGKKAAEFPRVRSTALYNLACAYAVTGENDAAYDALTQAEKAGFLDFDTMKSDPDLAPLRDQGRIAFPPRHEYETFTSQNGTTIEYVTVQPLRFDASKSYPAVLACPPGGQGPASADWALTALWGSGPGELGWILICPLVPAGGWQDSRAQRALGELLDHVKTEYSIEGGVFHIAGFGAGGATAIGLFQVMRDYFSDLLTASCYAWSEWKGADFDRLKGATVNLLAGKEDTYGADVAKRAAEALTQHGANARLTIVSGDGYLLESVHAGKLLAYMGGSPPSQGSHEP
jgi:tetratricopeptide (TPR) repeat protein